MTISASQFPDFIRFFPKAKLPADNAAICNFLNAAEGQVAFHTIPAGQTIPLHHHKDCLAILISGSLEVILGSKQFMASPGASWFIPHGVVHGGKAIEPSLLIEVFCEKRFETEC